MLSSASHRSQGTPKCAEPLPDTTSSGTRGSKPRRVGKDPQLGFQRARGKPGSRRCSFALTGSLGSILHKGCPVPPAVGGSRPASPRPASQWAPAPGCGRLESAPRPSAKAAAGNELWFQRLASHFPAWASSWRDWPRPQRRAPGRARTHFPGGGSGLRRALRPTRRADVAEGRQSARERPARARVCVGRSCEAGRRAGTVVVLVLGRRPSPQQHPRLRGPSRRDELGMGRTGPRTSPGRVCGSGGAQ